jgi:hypothetical protein
MKRLMNIETAVPQSAHNNPFRRSAEIVSQQWNVINPLATLLDPSQQQGVVDAEPMMPPGGAVLVRPVSCGFSIERQPSKNSK